MNASLPEAPADIGKGLPMKTRGSDVFHIREAAIFLDANENVSRAARADGAYGERLASRSREALEASETRVDS